MDDIRCEVEPWGYGGTWDYDLSDGTVMFVEARFSLSEVTFWGCTVFSGGAVSFGD